MSGMVNPSDRCLNCGESREAVKRQQLICGEVDSYTGELVSESPRHEYKITKARQRREAEYIEYLNKYYGDFVDSVKEKAC